MPKSIGDSRNERVARALCHAAATTENQPTCPVCAEHYGSCTMWQSFQREAAHAIRAMKNK